MPPDLDREGHSDRDHNEILNLQATDNLLLHLQGQDAISQLLKNDYVLGFNSLIYNIINI